MAFDKKIALQQSLIFLGFLMLRCISTALGVPALCSIALFSTLYLGRGPRAYCLIALLLFAGDWLLTGLQTGHYSFFYPGWIWQYIAFFAVILWGQCLLPSITGPRVMLGALTAPLLFFAISNFGVWCQGLGYAMNAQGLWQCWVKGLPFLKTAMCASFFYSGLLYLFYLRLKKSYLLRHCY